MVVQDESGKWTEVTDHLEIEQAFMENNQSRFSHSMREGTLLFGDVKEYKEGLARIIQSAGRNRSSLKEIIKTMKDG